jgi:hypothetical protein
MKKLKIKDTLIEIETFIKNRINRLKYPFQLISQVSFHKDGRVTYQGKDLLSYEQSPYTVFLNWLLELIKYATILSLTILMYRVNTWYSYGIMLSLLRWFGLNLLQDIKEPLQPCA